MGIFPHVDDTLILSDPGLYRILSFPAVMMSKVVYYQFSLFIRDNRGIAPHPRDSALPSFICFFRVFRPVDGVAELAFCFKELFSP